MRKDVLKPKHIAGPKIFLSLKIHPLLMPQTDVWLW